MIIFATTNSAKFNETSIIAKNFNLKLRSLNDFLNIDNEPEETGGTLEENSVIKVDFYSQFLPNESFILADDSGLEIDALNGEPGVKVRRWTGQKMSDDDIIEYCLTRLKNVEMDERTAKFRSVIAVKNNSSGEMKLFSGELEGLIREKSIGEKKTGFPFETLFYVLSSGLSLGDLRKISQHQKNPIHWTHREKALRMAFDWIKSQVSS